MLKWLFRLAIAYIVVGIVIDKYFHQASPSAVVKVESNYGEAVERICDKYGLPADYFKALIILESSADMPARSRFEPQVFQQLKALRDKRISAYGTLTQKDVRGMKDASLKMLATSWGPLQLMGYHTLRSKFTIADLTGKNGLEHSIKWCKSSYGSYLTKEEFRNAFHYHNTGRPHPPLWFTRTFDPQYVRNGMAYMRMMEQKRMMELEKRYGTELPEDEEIN